MSSRRRSPWTLAQRQTLLAMSVANVAVALDFAGVNVALPTIGIDFDASTGTLESITLAYQLTLTVLLVPAGRVAGAIPREDVCRKFSTESSSTFNYDANPVSAVVENHTTRERDCPRDDPDEQVVPQQPDAVATTPVELVPTFTG